MQKVYINATAFLKKGSIKHTCRYKCKHCDFGQNDYSACRPIGFCLVQ